MPGADEHEEPRAADGRVPGRRGLATRQRLLECTAEMLESSSYRDLKVIDIAREAGTSPATFYQYFADVEASILVLAEDMARDAQRLPLLVRGGTWRSKAGLARALDLVDAMFGFWDQYRPILRVVDLSTEEGDQRFRQIRSKLLVAVTDTLADVFRTFQEEGRHPPEIDARATAGSLVSMLAHVAQHRYGFEFWGIRTADVRATMSRQLYWGITGQKPPQVLG